MKEETIIFTDGASLGNPGKGGYGAVIIFGVGSDNAQVKEIGGFEPNTTNNRMEMMAVIEALDYLNKNSRNGSDGNDTGGKIIIYLDSSYVLKGATKWVYGWQESGWITKGKQEVLNRDLWERMLSVVSAAGSKNIEWKLISGHVGIAGNERVDKIATSFGASSGDSGSSPKLFSGSLKDYEKQNKIDILNIDHNVLKKAAKKKSSSRSSAPAYSYVSMVKGIIKTHATWAECEARVKGVSGTKFKKALSAEEEKEIIAEWKA